MVSLQGSELLSYKMVRIANEQSYMYALNQLNNLAIADHSFINEKSRQDQEIPLNFILREFSCFEDQDNLLSLPKN